MKRYRKIDEILKEYAFSRRKSKRAFIKKTVDSRNIPGKDCGFVYSQNDPSLKGLTYGKYPVSYNGCECIATYNALLYKGKDALLSDLLREFEENGLIGYYIFGRHSFFPGKFGTNPNKIKRALDAYGIEYETVKKERDLLSALSDGGYIVSFVNDSNLLHGVHTFFFTVSNGAFKVYNGYGKRDCKTYSEVRSGGKFITAYKIK